MNDDNLTLSGEEITECLQEVCETFSDPNTFDKMSFCEKAIVENIFLKLEKVFNQKINSKKRSDNITLSAEEITECLQEVSETFSHPKTFDKMSFCEKAIVENVFLKLEKVFNQKINSKKHKI